MIGTKIETKKQEKHNTRRTSNRQIKLRPIQQFSFKKVTSDTDRNKAITCIQT